MAGCLIMEAVPCTFTSIHMNIPMAVVRVATLNRPVCSFLGSMLCAENQMRNGQLDGT